MNSLATVGSALTKAADALESACCVWTTVWSLPQLGANARDPSLPPMLWLRHDRAVPECVSVFIDDVHLWSRRGRVAGDQRFRPLDKFGGEKENIQVSFLGHTAEITIVCPPNKMSKMGGGQFSRAFARDKIFYTLSLDGITIETDTEGKGRLPPPCSSGLHERIRIPELREVSKRVGTELDWKAETVVEYGIQVDQRELRWVRYSDFAALHRDICSCFSTSKEGAALPQPPKKTWLSSSVSKGEKFQTERRISLEKYLVDVFRTHRGPYLPYLLFIVGIFAEDQYLTAMYEFGRLKNSGAPQQVIDKAAAIDPSVRESIGKVQMPSSQLPAAIDSSGVAAATASQLGKPNAVASRPTTKSAQPPEPRSLLDGDLFGDDESDSDDDAL